MRNLLVSLCLLLLLSTPARALETVRLGFIPVGDCLQLYVAQDLGLFAEEGIAVEATPFKGGALIAMAVEAGELDAGWSNTVSLAQALDRGFDFTIISPGAFEIAPDHRSHSLLVRADSPIRTVADLRGKAVAINNLGNINEVAIAALAAEHGVQRDEIRLVEIPFPQMIPALEGGAVDAVLVLEPFVTLGRSGGKTRVLEPAALRAFGDRFLIASWFSTQRWIDANPETAKAFRRAMVKASAAIAADPARARAILTSHTKLDAALAKAITLPAFESAIRDDDVQPLIDLSAAFGFIHQTFPASRLGTDGP